MREMISLQLAMCLMILAGVVLKKTGIFGKTGQKNMTDLVIDFILPCSIVKSFMIEFSIKTLMQFGEILLISLLIQTGCEVLGKMLYGKKETSKGNCLRYGIICSNAGFLGNAIAEGVYGSAGLALASVYLIPQRIVMWSAGLAIFSGETDKKKVIKKVATHPCIIACIVGIFFMLSQVTLPDFIMKALSSFSGCLTPASMMVIGMILAEINPKELVNKEVIYYTVIRLLIIPALVWIPCLLFRVDALVTGISVLLAAMPAGATTSMLASKYDSDEKFATEMIIFSTLCSVITTMIWSMIL